MDMKHESSNSALKYIYRQLVKNGFTKTDAVEVIFADGMTPFELAQFFSDNTVKPHSIRRIASRLKQKLSGYSFVSFKNGRFSISLLQELETELSLNNNKQHTTATEENLHSDTETFEKPVTKNLEQEHKESHTPGKIVLITDEMVRDAKYMLTVLSGRYDQLTLEECLSAIRNIRTMSRHYDGQLVHKAIEAAYCAEGVKNVAGYVVGTARRKMEVRRVLSGSTDTATVSEKSIPETTRQEFARVYTAHFQAACQAKYQQEKGKDGKPFRDHDVHRWVLRIENISGYDTTVIEDNGAASEFTFQHGWSYEVRQEAVRRTLKDLGLPVLFTPRYVDPSIQTRGQAINA